jgi:para-aminobenzoate synthetase component 1
MLDQRLAEAQATEMGDRPDIPFTGGWLGWLGYDLAWEIEQLPYRRLDSLPFPVAFWYEPDCFAVLDHREQILWLAVTDPADLDPLQHRCEAASPHFQGGLSLNGVGRSLQEPLLSSDWGASQALTFASTQAEYEASVRRAKDYIQAGDIFQANLSLRFHTTTHLHSWSVYQALQHINPSPFASYWQTPWGSVVSCSPERLVERRQQVIQTRPIAGTRARGADRAADQRLAQELLDNRKENAEHIMLVDLERNDLGRVCQWGSVTVDELMTIERYSHVMHLVSNVRGRLCDRHSSIDVIRALFPGGTITGCPKVRCMEIIEELEPVRRSLFYGSCGYLDQSGQMDLNILIRTLLMAPASSHFTTVWGQVGAGIVADSNPTREWEESLQKAQAQRLALHLATELHPV